MSVLLARSLMRVVNSFRAPTSRIRRATRMSRKMRSTFSCGKGRLASRSAHPKPTKK